MLGMSYSIQRSHLAKPGLLVLNLAKLSQLYLGIGEQLEPRIMQHPFAYAKTDCGVIRYGTSPIFQQYLEFLRQRQNSGQ